MDTRLNWECTEWIAGACNERARQLYGEELPVVIEDRLDRELLLIQGKDMAADLMRAYLISKSAREEGTTTSFRGSIGSSFLAYLLEITDVNPLPEPYGYDLPCEFFYGYYGEKKADITLFVDPRIKKKYQSTQGIHLYSKKDTVELPSKEKKLLRERSEEIRNALPVKSLEDEVEAFGLLHGTGTWEGNGREKLLEGWHRKELIAYREDVMRQLQEFGMERETAFAMAEKTRRGLLTERDAEALAQFGIPESYVDSMRKIRVLFPKAHGIECVRLGLGGIRVS